MMNPKLVEGALGMLARLIPPEEYAKATKMLGELAGLLRSIEARAKAIEEGVTRIEAATGGLVDRVAVLESAALADSPAYSAQHSERALWMVPGSIEKALAPSTGNQESSQ